MFTSSNCYQKQKIQEHKMFGIMPGLKPLPLGEENPHKILPIKIPIDEYQDYDP